MGTGYVRNDVTNNIADGNVINASDLDGEFDAIEAAFNASTGHTHDGTASEGAPITVVGPAQEWVVDGTALYPKTDDTYDLGKTGAEIKDAYIDGIANIDGLVVTATATFAGATIANLGTVTTADINGGTADGVVIGGSTPAAGTFTDVVLSDTTPTITLTDTDSGTDAIISSDNAGSLRIRADSGNEASASEISFEVDGVVVGTWDATELQVIDTAPTIVLVDSNGNAGNAEIAFAVTGASYGFVTRDNTGTPLGYFDYLAGRSTSGVTSHTFNILGSNVFDIDSAGVDVTGDLDVSASANIGSDLEVTGTISSPLKIEVRGDTSYFDARATGASDELGFRLLDNADVQRAGFIWDEANTDALLQTYSSLGALVHEYDLTNANFDITTASATNSGFNLSLNGTRRITITTAGIIGYAADGTTAVSSLPLTSSDNLGAIAAWNNQSGSTANLAVDSAGLIRRITSTGEFKINRELLGETGGIIDGLDPVSFESTHEADQGRRYTGFIAEEIAEIYPEASVDNGQNYDVRALVAILWKEVQELRQRVSQLEAN